MCLAEVNLTRTGKGGSVVSKGGRFVGYKAFEIWKVEDEETGKKTETIDWGLLHSNPGIGKWLKATNTVLGLPTNCKYSSGFHIFTDEQDAIDYYGEDNALFSVEFRDIVAIGKQSLEDDGLTIIAKEMKLLKRLK